ncbi:hypothetical protein chiPu_0031990, partial [Chiloscyllium punctatum]|nr:hypothetical protein [Chiloscyllium punctatum]
MVPEVFVNALLVFTGRSTNSMSSRRRPGPITTCGSSEARKGPQAVCVSPAAAEYGSRLKAGTTLNMRIPLRLALGIEHRRRHRLGGRLAGPHHELERRIVALAGVDRIDHHRLALRGGGGEAAGQHQRLAMHHHAGVGPQIEMADPQLFVDRGDQPLHLGAARLRHLHVEGAGEMQRLDLAHPGERELIVDPVSLGDDRHLV